MSESSQKEDIFTSRDARTWQDSQERYRAITSTYTVQPDDDILLCDTSSGTFTVTLPDAITKRKITFIRTGGTTQVTVVAPNSQTINDDAQYYITTLYVATIFKGLGDKYHTLSTLNSSSVLQTNSITPVLTLYQTGIGDILTMISDELGSPTTRMVIDKDGKVSITGSLYVNGDKIEKIEESSTAKMYYFAGF